MSWLKAYDFNFNIIPYFLIFLVSIFSSLSSNINSADLSRFSPAHLFECLSPYFSMVLFTTALEWWSTFCFSDILFFLLFSSDSCIFFACSEIDLPSPWTWINKIISIESIFKRDLGNWDVWESNLI